MHEADAFSLVGHLLLTCHTVLETVFVIGSLHTLSSVMMQGGDASFRLDIFCLLASRHLGSHCDCCWHTLSCGVGA